jgi:hypothetical protein
MRLLLAVVFVIAGLTCAHAQVNPANPNTPGVPVTPTPLPSTFPQFQNYTACLMNCDTRVGTCQSSCSLNNSPSFTLAPLASTSPGTGTGTVTSGAASLTQCNMTCVSQSLVCKQSCTAPH